MCGQQGQLQWHCNEIFISFCGPFVVDTSFGTYKKWTLYLKTFSTKKQKFINAKCKRLAVYGKTLI